MNSKFEIFNVQNAVEIGITLRHFWFRGHPKTFNSLNPKIFRPPYIRNGKPIDRLEFSITENFKSLSPIYSPIQIPEYDNNSNWYFLMQHHGAPTRLLDWTESVLIALYFTVSDNQDQDGELWCLDYLSLNRKHKFDGLPTPINPILKYLTTEPLNIDDREPYAQRFGLTEIPQYPFALMPTMFFPRMAAQISWFTIHPTPPKGYTLKNILKKDVELIRYIVNKNNKIFILNDLESLGINESFLFRDLDSLSRDVSKQRSYVYPPEKTIPPRF